MFKPGDKVKVKRDIYRQSLLYSKEGESGDVVEIFYTSTSSETKKPYAKVLIDNLIKTFRLTTIEKI